MPLWQSVTKWWIYLLFILISIGKIKADNETNLPETPEPPVSEDPTVLPTDISSNILGLKLKEIILEDSENYTLHSTNFPELYPLRNEELIISAQSGYSLKITIEYLNLESENGDYLVIKPGRSLEDKGAGKVFVYKLNKPRQFIVHSNTVYISLQVAKREAELEKSTFAAGKDDKGFSLQYQRVGEELTTTTENPTTVVTWPTPGDLESMYYTAYVSGKSQEDFNDTQTQLDFKTALAEMATEYCNTTNMLLTDYITEANVQLNYLIQCNYSWPNSDTCMKTRFAIPVLLQDNATWGSYQLTSDNLEEMWLKLAGSHLPKYGMDVYSVPNNKSSVIKWLVIFCTVLVAFLILLYFVNAVGRRFSPLNLKRKKSDTDGFITAGNKISNASSLAPNPYQSTPAFFDNDYCFDQFEVDIGLPKKTTYTDLSYPLSEDDSDNDIIFSNFSNSQNNVEKVNTESHS